MNEAIVLLPSALTKPQTESSLILGPSQETHGQRREERRSSPKSFQNHMEEASCIHLGEVKPQGRRTHFKYLKPHHVKEKLDLFHEVSGKRREKGVESTGREF